MPDECERMKKPQLLTSRQAGHVPELDRLEVVEKLPVTRSGFEWSVDVRPDLGKKGGLMIIAYQLE